MAALLSAELEALGGREQQCFVAWCGLRERAHLQSSACKLTLPAFRYLLPVFRFQTPEGSESGALLCFKLEWRGQTIAKNINAFSTRAQKQFLCSLCVFVTTESKTKEKSSLQPLILWWTSAHQPVLTVHLYILDLILSFGNYSRWLLLEDKT